MTTKNKIRITITSAVFLTQAVVGFGQDQGGWRRVGERPQGAPTMDAQVQPPPPGFPQQQQGAPPQDFPQQQPNQQQQVYQQQGPPPQYFGGPLVLPAGSWITVRVNEPLSSDHNQPGDAFTATLAQPLVANGRVIARRGQMVAGHVLEVQKGGRVKGTARIAIELTELSLVDGQQVTIKTAFADRGSDTSVGRDVGAVATTTGLGAAIGAAADGGFGAGMGAIAGAAVGTIGVLATRGNSAVVYPEQLLTFRLQAPITVDTSRSEQAFQPAGQDAYDQRESSYREGPPQRGPAPAPYPRYYGYGYGPGYSYGYGYPGYYAPYFYGPSFYFSSGPRYYRGYAYRRR